jgi:hypothetical protein
MSDQPEALRLADLLMRLRTPAELRQLYATAFEAEPAVLWHLSGDGYAPVTLEQSHPPEPLTLDEALAHGWRRFVSAPPAQQAEPVREWQFLSAEERYRIADESASTIVAVLATEAALKEKNHG